MKTELDVLPLLKRSVRWMGFAIVLFALFHLAGMTAREFTGEQRYFHKYANLDEENNPATWFSTMGLGLCSLLAGVVWGGRKAQGDLGHRYWGGLAVIFLLMSLDEAASLHEFLVPRLQTFLPSEGHFRFTWVIPGLIFIGAFVAVYTRWWYRLPMPARNGFGLAGFAYCAGALGLEMVGGRLLDDVSRQSWAYGLSTGMEETLEMIGIFLVYRTLVQLLGAVEIHTALAPASSAVAAEISFTAARRMTSV